MADPACVSFGYSHGESVPKGVVRGRWHVFAWAAGLGLVSAGLLLSMFEPTRIAGQLTMALGAVDAAVLLTIMFSDSSSDPQRVFAGPRFLLMGSRAIHYKTVASAVACPDRLVLLDESGRELAVVKKGLFHTVTRKAGKRAAKQEARFKALVSVVERGMAAENPAAPVSRRASFAGGGK